MCFIISDAIVGIPGVTGGRVPEPGGGAQQDQEAVWGGPLRPRLLPDTGEWLRVASVGQLQCSR